MSQAINQVVEQIVNLRQEVHTEIGGLRHEMHREIGGLRKEMHEMKSEMNQRFSGLETRMGAVETKLGMRQEWQSEFRSRFFDYGFRVAWLLLGMGIFYTLNTHLSALKPLLH